LAITSLAFHVGRGAGTALDHVDHELFVQGAGPHFLGSRNDGVGELGVQQSQFAVALRCGQLDRRQCGDEIRIDRDRGPADGEILHRPQRVDAVIGLCRHIAVAQKIVFTSCRHRDTLSPSFS